MLTCPICRKDFSYTQEDIPDGYTRIHCCTFGFDFLLSNELTERPEDDDIREKSFDLIAEHLLHQKMCGNKYWRFYYAPEYTSTDIDPAQYINIAEKLNSFPETVSDVTNRTLLNIAILAPRFGDYVFSEPSYRRFFFEHGNATSPVSGVLSMLEEMGLLKEIDTFSYKVSAKGWEKIESLRQRESEIKQGFIAMSFAPETRPIREAIKKAINAAGFSIYISDEKEHNNQIVPEMFFEIKRSKFIVVDVTQPNYGAYYEAGYAQALNKQVIICCRREEHESPDKSKRPHFDIAQKPVIVWETEEELISKLKRRIEATVY